ncbi:putative Gamma-glutamylcyclotransferase [Hypsibius exemplaris]|uniref:gamma-glutamylcyclotransferase n=1 Tax=Hypsibius exemplaris TaxID=2072580 RepID=A0A1W0X4B3_HYPEX|nr:putative Gamma-glutamylcyclotransferase [Hypsibius exemplaris]
MLSQLHLAFSFFLFLNRVIRKHDSAAVTQHFFRRLPNTTTNTTDYPCSCSVSCTYDALVKGDSEAIPIPTAPRECCLQWPGCDSTVGIHGHHDDLYTFYIHTRGSKITSCLWRLLKVHFPLHLQWEIAIYSSSTTTQIPASASTCADFIASDPDPNGKFLYFAFGSNLFEDRIHINCPSAERVGPGKLFGYQLAFNYNSLRWRGHVATIKESEDDHLWGCIWTIKNSELHALDLQEGVHYGLYRPLSVQVTSPEGITLSVRTYQMTRPYEEDAKPSVVYKRIIALGAKQSNLPSDYLQFIDRIPDNGYDGPVEVECNLAYRQDSTEPQFVRRPSLCMDINVTSLGIAGDPERLVPITGAVTISAGVVFVYSCDFFEACVEVVVPRGILVQSSSIKLIDAAHGIEIFATFLNEKDIPTNTCMAYLHVGQWQWAEPKYKLKSSKS